MIISIFSRAVGLVMLIQRQTQKLILPLPFFLFLRRDIQLLSESSLVPVRVVDGGHAVDLMQEEP